MYGVGTAKEIFYRPGMTSGELLRASVECATALRGKQGQELRSSGLERGNQKARVDQADALSPWET